MTYRIKLVRMVNGERSESWACQPFDHTEGLGSRYDRTAAIGIAEDSWQRERVRDSGLVAVELVEVT